MAKDLETSTPTTRIRKIAKLDRKEAIVNLGLAPKPQTKPRNVYRATSIKATDRELYISRKPRPLRKTTKGIAKAITKPQTKYVR